MKYIKLVLVFVCTGCYTYPRPWAQSQILASQANQYAAGIAGVNVVSVGLLKFQNYNRNINATIQNPWNGFYTARNLWHP